MATEITLSREWKQSLTTSKMRPFAMQVSLWDLLFFYNSAGEQCFRYLRNPSDSNWKCKGFELPHSIIVLDEKMYLKPDKLEDRVGHRIIKKATVESDEEIIQKNLTTFDKWSALGFDISLPWFDVRTKPLFLKSSNVAKYIQGENSASFSVLLNSLKPEKLNTSDFYYISSEQEISGFSSGFKIWDKDAALKPKTSYDFYLRSVLKPDINLDANTWQDYPDPWYIATEDDYTDYWEKNGQTESGTLGADIILCNKDTSFEKRFIIPDSGFSAYNSICLNYNSQRVWKNLLRYFTATNMSYEPNNNIALSGEFSIGSINPTLNYLIKHCYLWIKCAFFADYVDYRDFNQSLNQKSQVIHNNLILGKGDFNRYEELYSKGKISTVDYAKNTRPYFPTTTPIKDKLKEVLLTEEEYNSNLSKNAIITNIINNADSPESKIGAIPIEPFENFNTENTSPNFTTTEVKSEPPQIWLDTESRKKPDDYEDQPILIGKEGNLITSGRILSPTIDELWHTIKEMIAGKKSDTADITADDFGGYPINVNENTKNPYDTRLTLPTHKFINRDGKEKKGDPTVMKMADGVEDNITYRVQSWISNPDKIIYNIINDLKLASKEICSVGPNLEAIVNKIENLPKPEEYLPMATVPSLRELESILKGLRWNLMYYVRFMLHNAVYVGSNGKVNSDDKEYNKAAGTAYLLHKEVISGISGIQNTVYDERFNRNIPGTYDGMGVSQITSGMFGNNNQDIIPPWTVFMSAAGTWQSVSQCMNLRIRNDEIW